jgi:hypothetical protein
MKFGLATALVSLLMGMCLLFSLAPATIGRNTLTATPTRCPDSSTPERGMPTLTQHLETALTRQGINVVTLSVIGLSNCPGETPAPGWWQLTIAVSAKVDAEELGKLTAIVLEAIPQPSGMLYLTFKSAKRESISLDCRVSDGKKLIQQGLTGKTLFEALNNSLK